MKKDQSDQKLGEKPFATEAGMKIFQVVDNLS
jgi:hypothetical protein